MCGDAAESYAKLPGNFDVNYELKMFLIVKIKKTSIQFVF